MININIVLCEKFEERNVQNIFNTLTMSDKTTTSFEILSFINYFGEEDTSMIFYYYLFNREKYTDGTREGFCLGATRVPFEKDGEGHIAGNAINKFSAKNIPFKKSGNYCIELYRYDEIPFEQENTNEDYAKVLKNGKLISVFDFKVAVL